MGGGPALYSCSDVSFQLGTYYSGQNGADNASQFQPKDPESISFDFVSSVIQFKMFLLENWIRGNYIEIYNILNSNDISEKYDIYNLIDELYGIESLYFKVTHDVVRFYDSLLKHILHFSNNHSTKLTKDIKRALSYLYTTTLSKLCVLKHSNDNEIVYTNLPKQLDLLQKELQEMEKIDDQQAINNYRDTYQKLLDTKIDQTKNIVNTVIVPEINKEFKALHSDTVTLVDTIIKLEGDAKRNEEKIRKEKKEFQNKLIMHRFASVLKFVGAGLNVLGPIGESVGTIVGTTASVVDSLSDDPTPKEIFEQVKKFSKTFIEQIQSIREKYLGQKKAAEETVEDQIKNVDSLIEEHNADEEKLKGLKDKLVETKNDLKKESDDSLDANSNKNIKQALSSVKDYLKETWKSATVEKVKKFLEKGSTIVNVLRNARSELFEEIKNDEEKLEKYDERINTAHAEYELLNKFEDNVYTVILPQIKELQNTITSMENQIKVQSHVQLDMSKWKVKEVLEDVKELIKKMTSLDQLQGSYESFEDCLNKIENGMNIMIDVYDRIDSYRDNADLAAYIANVGSSNPKFGKLDKNMTDLKAILQSNLVLKHYRIAVDSFTQHYFPFASIILDQNTLPKSLQMKDTKSLIMKAVDIVGKLSTQIVESKISFGYYDQFISTVEDMKFYEWPNDKSKNKITNLLSGQNISLNANVNKSSVSHHAVAFKDLQLKFVLKDSKLQQEFDKVLNDFSISMEIIDNCYYRCDTKIYYRSVGEIVTLKYHFERDVQGKPKGTNSIYDQISENDPFLSPYTTWNVQLHAVKTSDFSTLQKFVNESIDLRLMGTGKFIDSELDLAQICSHQNGMKTYSKA